MDTYRTFGELERKHERARDFALRYTRKASEWIVVAPHGGRIEPGTSELAEAVAAQDLSFYAFEGRMRKNNKWLHITSTRFDEPECLALLAASDKAVAIHGQASSRPAVFVGGRDASAVAALIYALQHRGFRAEQPLNAGLKGQDPRNICNRCQSGAGVQLELSKGLRRTLFRSLSPKGRQTTTTQFRRLVRAVREGLGL